MFGIPQAIIWAPASWLPAYEALLVFFIPPFLPFIYFCSEQKLCSEHFHVSNTFQNSNGHNPFCEVFLQNKTAIYWSTLKLLPSLHSESPLLPSHEVQTSHHAWMTHTAIVHTVERNMHSVDQYNPSTCIAGTIWNNYTSSSWTHCFSSLSLLPAPDSYEEFAHTSHWRLPASECCVICHIIITWCLSLNVAHHGSFIPVEFVRITAIAFFVVDFVQNTGSSRHDDLTSKLHTHSHTYLRYKHTHTHYDAFCVCWWDTSTLRERRLLGNCVALFDDLLFMQNRRKKTICNYVEEGTAEWGWWTVWIQSCS